MKTNIASAAAIKTERYDAFSVRQYGVNEEINSEWLKVGTAFPHKDKKGFNLFLQAVPISGEVVIRLHEPKAAGDAGEEL